MPVLCCMMLMFLHFQFFLECFTGAVSMRTSGCKSSFTFWTIEMNLSNWIDLIIQLQIEQFLKALGFNFILIKNLCFFKGFFLSKSN